MEKFCTSFRPLTGILFFNVNSSKQLGVKSSGFRPLTGILFFNTGKKSIVYDGVQVSVPLRGFCFST